MLDKHDLSGKITSMGAQPMKPKNPAAVQLGSLGGKARAKKLSAQRRSEIAKLAVQARERKRQKGKP